VDRFQVIREKDQGIHLTLYKEKVYPPLKACAPAALKPFRDFSLKSPNPEDIKLFVHLVNAHYPPHLFPLNFQFPGKVVDMAAAGEYQVRLSVDFAGQIGGGLFWRWAGSKTVECYGPYLFIPEPKTRMAQALLEDCLAHIGRTPAVGMMCRLPTADFPKEHFESLGSLTLYAQEGPPVNLVTYFRQIQEDTGSLVYAHQAIISFLKAEYQELVLPREIRLVQDLGEIRSKYSVLTAELARPQSRVILRPILSGADDEANLADHVALFHQEGIKNIFFEMDLAAPWQSLFTPALLKNGFVPRLVLPYAGEGDLVLFQLSPTQP
jgi:hypothetical protein